MTRFDASMIESLRERFMRSCISLGSTVGQGHIHNKFNDVLNAYSGPHRRYHTMNHIVECLDLLDWAHECDQIEHRDELELALWYHDLVYVVDRDMPRNHHENEIDSALLMTQQLLGINIDLDRVRLIDMLIRLTAEHESDDVRFIESGLMHDIDLAILGSSPERYAEYVEQVRAEHDQFDEPLFDKGRMSFLRRVDSWESIFCTTHFHLRFEERARINTKRELRFLERKNNS